jgi:hypothetical protein
MGFYHLMDTMDEYIRNHDPMRDAGQTDIAAGMAVAEWLTDAVHLQAEGRSALSAGITRHVIPAGGVLEI